MKILNMRDLVEEYSERASKFCMYISLDKDISLEELVQLSSFFKHSALKNFYFSLNECKAVLIFDTEEEMIECFDTLEDVIAVHAITYSKGEIKYES